MSTCLTICRLKKACDAEIFIWAMRFQQFMKLMISLCQMPIMIKNLSMVTGISGIVSTFIRLLPFIIWYIYNIYINSSIKQFQWIVTENKRLEFVSIFKIVEMIVDFLSIKLSIELLGEWFCKNYTHFMTINRLRCDFYWLNEKFKSHMYRMIFTCNYELVYWWNA